MVFHGTGPVTVSGRTLVPVSGVFETLGFTVEWEAETESELRTAVENAEEPTTIVLTADIKLTDSGGSLTIPANANITLGSFGNETFGNTVEQGMGGGVFVNRGSFTMNDGSIHSNHAIMGGGVFLFGIGRITKTAVKFPATTRKPTPIFGNKQTSTTNIYTER